MPFLPPREHIAWACDPIRANQNIHSFVIPQQSWLESKILFFIFWKSFIFIFIFILFYFLNLFKFTLFYFIFLAAPCGMWGLSSPTRDLNLCPLHWKCGVLSTGPPGKSLFLFFKFYWSIVNLQCRVSFRCTAQWFNYTFSLIGYYKILNSVPRAI